MLARAASRALRGGVSLRLAGARCLSAAGGSSQTNAELTKLFLDLDASAAPSAASSMPVKLTGRSGELVEELWVKAGSKSGPRFDAAATALDGLVAAVSGAGLVVDRFFTTANYSAVECTVRRGAGGGRGGGCQGSGSGRGARRGRGRWARAGGGAEAPRGRAAGLHSDRSRPP